MGMETIGTGLKTVVGTGITSLQIYAPNELPDSVNVPCAVILPGPTDYDTTFSTDYDLTLRLIILVGKQDQPSAINKILDYIEPTGSTSIVALVKADKTLSGSCDSAKVTRNSGIGFTVWGGMTYISTEFTISIWA